MKAAILSMLILGCSFATTTHAQDIPDSQPTKPLVDMTYWPLTASLTLASTASVGQAFILGQRLSNVVNQDISDVLDPPDLSLFVTIPTGILGVTSGLALGYVADTISHGTVDTEQPQTPINPAHAASIGSGILWGSVLGLTANSLIPTMGVVFFGNRFHEEHPSVAAYSYMASYALFGLGAAPLGGWIAASMPAPVNTAQVGLRNLGGTLGMLSGLTFSPMASSYLAVNQIGIHPAFAASGLFIFPIAGLIAGDLVGQTGIYTDTDVLWTGLAAAAGAGTAYAVTQLAFPIAKNSTLDTVEATNNFYAFSTQAGMYTGAGLTLVGLAVLHTIQAE